MEEIKIEIPLHFLCPISLQLMKDPVTILTGITYDRERIEKWLYTCKNTTCPVTMSHLTTLPSDSRQNHIMITPNHTLRCLIQSWCILHASDDVDRIPTPKQAIIVSRAYINKLLNDQNQSMQSRIRILTLSNSPEERTKTILDDCGAFKYVGSILVGNEYGIGDREEALYFFSQLDEVNSESILKGLIKSNLDHLLFVNSIVELLRFGSGQVRKNAIKVLKCVYKVADQTQLSNVTLELLKEFVNIIGDNISNQSTTCALKFLVELNPWGQNRVKTVDAGMVHVLIDLLIDGLDRRLSELGLVVLDQLCGCAEGRSTLVGHGAGIAVVSKKILRVSHVASDRAIRILSSVLRYLATGRVLREMMEVGVVVKLCLVIQVEYSSKTKERAKEMLRMYSSVWKMSPCIPPHLRSSYPSS